ncbi:MAG: type IV pilin protein [bacterium]
MSKSPQFSRGFTLIEVMIVLVVVAILAAVAFPQYADFVRKGKRSQAMNALENIRFEQEKWRANDTDYGTDAEVDPADNINANAPDYTVTVTANSATSFTATATATGDQANDDSDCTTFTITEAGPNGSAAILEKCWKR